jgi:hypothetical protein
MRHADTRFLRDAFISKLNQCMKRICYLRIVLFKHGLIRVLCMKRIQFFLRMGLLKHR